MHSAIARRWANRGSRWFATTRSTTRGARLGALTVIALGAVPAHGQVLFHEAFDGASLNTSRWCTPTGPGSYFGRTQIRPPSSLPALRNGVLRLELSTYNPTGPSFYGSEIETRTVYARGKGVAFKARVRIAPTGVDANNQPVPLPCGLVASLFSFTDNGCGTQAIPVRDEIDVELLSNDVVATPARQRVLTNVFVQEPFSSPGATAFAPLAGLDLTTWNELEVRWLIDRVQWYVNGSLVREEQNHVPAGPQTIRLNFWAPDSSWPAAYCASLQPTRVPANERRWFYEVDWVEACTLFDCELRGSPRVGVSPIYFSLQSPVAQHGSPALVLLSHGPGAAAAGLRLIPNSECLVMLDIDPLFVGWLEVLPLLGLATLSAMPAATTPFVIPIGFPRNQRIYYGGVSLDRSLRFAGVAATKSFVTQE